MAPELTNPDFLGVLRERVAKLEAKVCAAEKEVAGAKTDLDRRLLEMNEFRAQINEERSMYVRTSQYEREYQTLLGKFGSGYEGLREKHESDVKLIRDDIGSLQRSRAGALGSMAAWGGFVGAILAIAALLLAFLNRVAMVK